MAVSVSSMGSSLSSPSPSYYSSGGGFIGFIDGSPKLYVFGAAAKREALGVGLAAGAPVELGLRILLNIPLGVGAGPDGDAKMEVGGIAAGSLRTSGCCFSAANIEFASPLNIENNGVFDSD